MSLETAKPDLNSELNDAWTKASQDGAKDGAVSDTVINNLASDIADAIDKYTKSALVTTVGKTNPGQPIIPGTVMTAIGTTGTGGLE